jgi:hypothetical protein
VVQRARILLRQRLMILIRLMAVPVPVVLLSLLLARLRVAIARCSNRVAVAIAPALIPVLLVTLRLRWRVARQQVMPLRVLLPLTRNSLSARVAECRPPVRAPRNALSVLPVAVAVRARQTRQWLQN